jgi:LAS superfamily LD-carboxypeptidase LdcB
MTAPAGAARARVTPVTAALAVLAFSLYALVGAPGARAMGSLPACRYDDVLTTPRGYGDWPVTLVDTILRVPSSYVPPDLVPVTDAGIAGTGRTIRAVAIDDLRAMAAAARVAGAPIGVESGYRSYAEQRRLFDDWVASAGNDATLERAARPGHSEHQLGLAIDFRSVPRSAPHAQQDWATTPAGAWMASHAWEYGWLSSYPAGASGASCYTYEPWHFRYVGRELAARIHAAHVTVREYLWTNYTTTVLPMVGLPVPVFQAMTPRGVEPADPVSAVAPIPLAAANPIGRAAATSPPAARPAIGTSSPPGIGADVTPGIGADASVDPGPDISGDAAPAGGVDAGLAVVAGALAISLAALSGAWIAGRRQRGGGPGEPRGPGR